MTKDLWMESARDSLGAAGILRESHPRSAISRAYYAAFAAGHATLIHMGEHSRAGLGTRSHESLPGALRSTLTRLGVNQLPGQARQTLLGCQKARLIADYAPDWKQDGEDSRASVRHAGQLVKMPEALLQ